MMSNSLSLESERSHTASTPRREGAPSMLWDHPEGLRRVLLVEDAPFLRYAFGRLLRLHGYDVKEADDGREALDCLATFRPHVVVTDLMIRLSPL